MYIEPHRQLDRDLPRLDMYSTAFRAKMKKRQQQAPAPVKTTAKKVEDALVEKIVSGGEVVEDFVIGRFVGEIDEARVLRLATKRKIVRAARKRVKAMLMEAKKEAQRIKVEASTAAKQIVADAQTAAEQIVDNAEQVVAQPRRRAVRDIIREVANAHGFLADDLIGYSRLQVLVEVRHAAMVAAYLERPDLSSKKIGQYFHRDHTTILYAIDKAGVRRDRGRASSTQPTGR